MKPNSVGGQPEVDSESQLRAGNLFFSLRHRSVATVARLDVRFTTDYDKITIAPCKNEKRKIESPHPPIGSNPFGSWLVEPQSGS
jgi:hypothetical protein